MHHKQYASSSPTKRNLQLEFKINNKNKTLEKKSKNLKLQENLDRISKDPDQHEV